MTAVRRHLGDTMLGGRSVGRRAEGTIRVDGFEALALAATHLGAGASIVVGEDVREPAAAVCARALDALFDVLLLAELNRRDLEVTRIDLYGDPVVDAGPGIEFVYRGRRCGAMGMEDRSWHAFINPAFDIDPDHSDYLLMPVGRIGRSFEDAVADLFGALDVLVERASALEVQWS